MLRPCEYCNSATVSLNNSLNHKEQRIIFVKCLKCNNSTRKYDTEAEAVKEWNSAPEYHINPCPFCKSPKTKWRVGYHEKKERWVFCFNCDARGSVTKTEKEAIESWNALSIKAWLE